MNAVRASVDHEAGGRPSLVGARVPRVNDPKLLTGAGRYVDDLELPGMVHATVLRSPVPHGVVRGSDPTGALARSDAVGVITPEAARETTGVLPCVWVMPEQRVAEYPVVPEVVRYVGQPLGVVVAESRAAAEDAAELVTIEIDELDAVADAAAAVTPDAPLLYPEWGTNVAVQMDRGDPPEIVEAAIAEAAHVVELQLRVQRLTGLPIEPRGVVARWDSPTGELTLWSSTQVPHHVRDGLADALGLPHDRVRVIAPDVGGGFGPKDHLYSDEVLICLAAMRLKRPVKWIEDRQESFTATGHGRDQLIDARLALDADGRFIALHAGILGNLGAHPSNVGAGPVFVCANMLPGPYRFESVGATVRCTVTNTTPVGAYRGFGMQQAAWVRERLVEEAARRLGVDSLELRRRNMLTVEELPYTTRTMQNYDSGDYVRALELAAELIEADEPPADDGRRRGIGLCPYVEFTGLGPTVIQELVGFRLNGYETAVVRVEPDGSVTVLIGTCSQGQGHETTLAQLAAERLGLPLEDVRLVCGDTASAPYSSAGTIASRSMAVGGGAVLGAATRVREKLARIAAHRLEAAPEDLEVVDRCLRVRGSPEVAIPIRDLAEHAWLGWQLPEGMQAGLEEREVHDPPDISYSYATHAAAIAVDPGTGEIEVERYAVVHDCGKVVNPMIVDGQIHGGVAQGIGGALFETVPYDAAARPGVQSLLEYLVPTSTDVPDLAVEHIEHPSPDIPGGMKGMGEGGTIAPAGAIGNALANAMPEIAELVTETPLSPPRVWRWISETGEQEVGP
ncbi:MAG: xanthine dehydrogenase family protein molybdopterin-binding subunit [Solirubrobacterales bacterium]